jgi:probable phosphoglycerate mutase
MAAALYFVRHGETQWNVEGRLQGQRDVPLNALGRRQAAECGAILAALLARDGLSLSQLDFVASPLSRARETMERLREVLGLDPRDYRTDARLAELSFGTWEGSTLAELRVLDPARSAAREHDKWSFVPPQGESYALLSERVRTWYAEVGANTVAVAHGGTARVLMAQLGVVPFRQAPVVTIEQGAVYVFAAAGMNIHRSPQP